MAQILKDFGTRVQKSVFECHLTADDLQTLEERLRRTVRPSRDLVRIYSLCRACRDRTRGIPDPAAPPPVQFV